MLNKTLTVLSIALLSACTPNKAELSHTTVTITNLAKNSGGTGIVLRSKSTASQVLTNGHVCGVAANGGLVIDDNGDSTPVISYKLSPTHDLCLIEVASDLHGNTELSPEPPVVYEEATISGHPNLLPTVINTGRFSGRQIIQVMMGARDCSEEEKADPVLGLFCGIFGKLPLVKSFEAVLVSATIQPGSSGSGIYNSGNQLAAVVFAGSGDFGYAFAVPYEYVYNFVNFEVYKLPSITPSYFLGLTSRDSSSNKEYRKKIQDACKEPKNDAVKKFCNLYASDVIFRNE